jgi:hypothetical protein
VHLRQGRPPSLVQTVQSQLGIARLLLGRCRHRLGCFLCPRHRGRLSVCNSHRRRFRQRARRASPRPPKRRVALSPLRRVSSSRLRRRIRRARLRILKLRHDLPRGPLRRRSPPRRQGLCRRQWQSMGPGATRNSPLLERSPFLAQRRRKPLLSCRLASEDRGRLHLRIHLELTVSELQGHSVLRNGGKDDLPVCCQIGVHVLQRKSIYLRCQENRVSSGSRCDELERASCCRLKCCCWLRR